MAMCKSEAQFLTEIKYKKSFSLSSPNRLVIVFEGLDKLIQIKSEEIRGPRVEAPEQALEGFIRSNKIEKKDLFKNKTEKGEFYFYKTKSKLLNTKDLLVEFIPRLLQNYQWKKSMKWGEYDLNWGRPLKSILSVFDRKVINFKFHHISSSNLTYVDKDFEEKKKIFIDFKSYEKFFKKQGILVNQDKRKEFINKEFSKILSKRKLTIKDNPKLLDEVTNLVDNPNVLMCSFNKKFLSIPKEILILTMQSHQKYFPTFDSKDEITNEFLIVTNKKDQKGLIKIGNERVVEARLSDAEFFWNKDKTQNLVKKVSELKLISFFKGLGTYFDKVQRMRKLGSLISDELLISKEKVELSVSLSKTDLISDIVREFPELQGVMGGYLSDAQGFEKEISEAIKEQYLPVGMDSSLPKKPYSIALSISDKIDTLIGFFGINEKPTSSKDPFALRRLALGIIRILLESDKEFKIKDLINYSINLYDEQSFKFSNKNVQNDLNNFLMERVKFYMKEKEIRFDIIEAALNSFGLDQITKIYQKSLVLNKVFKVPAILDNCMASKTINVNKKYFGLVHIDSHLASNSNENTSDIVACYCLDDFTKENGATKIWPKSHLSGIRIQNDKNYSKLIKKRHKYVEAKKGSVIFFLGQTWHQIGKNTNSKRRWGILCHYKRWWIKPSTDWTKCGPKIFKLLNDKQKELFGFTSISPKFNFKTQTRTLKTLRKSFQLNQNYFKTIQY